MGLCLPSGVAIIWGAGRPLCGDELIVIMNYQLSHEDGEQGESTDSLQGQLHTPEQLHIEKYIWT